MSKVFDNFIGLQEVTRTLRFRLLPVEETKKYLKDIKKNDEKRAKNYPIVKKLIDDALRECINESYSKINIDFTDLYEAYFLDDEKELKKIQDRYKKYLDKIIKKSKKYTSIKGDKFIKALQNNPNLTKEEEEALKTFDKFTVYFLEFKETRKNVFSIEDISTSLYYRMIDDNFEIYIKNLNFLENINKNCPEIISKVEENLKKGKIIGKKENLIEDYFQVNSYNKYLIQDGIDLYNTIIGGYVKNAEKYTGINEEVNLFNQKEKSGKKINNLIKLKKQILSIKEKNPIFDVIETDEQLYQKIKLLYEKFKTEKIIENIKQLINNIPNYDLDKIYLSTQGINRLSVHQYKAYDFIINRLKENIEKEILKEKNKKTLTKKDKSEIENKLAISANGEKKKIKYLSINYIDEKCNIDKTKETIDIMKIYNDIFNELMQKNIKLMQDLEKIIPKLNAENIKYEKNMSKIKAFMDSIQEIILLFKYFNNKKEIFVDGNFYFKYDDLLEKLLENTTVLNQVRNYVTKSEYSTEKIKLKFDCPTLVSGWTKSKEKDNKSVILRKGEKFYLGILTKNIDFDKNIEDKSEEYYEKMNYYLFPGPNKMFPKCMFTKEVKKHFEDSNKPYDLFTDAFQKSFKVDYDLFETYKVEYNGKKKFQVDYLRKNPKDIKGYKKALKIAIDGCKEFLKCYKTTQAFDTSTLKETEEYKTIDEFYKDVSKLAYKIEFKKIKTSFIEKHIKNGNLLLFQIYNKDFSKNKRGKDNLHTMYLKEIFSDENIEKSIFRLSGNAEVFFREKSIKKPYYHEKGDIVVNKTFIDEDGKQNNIPEKYVLEINEALRSNKIDSLSQEAKNYYEKADKRKLEYRITKNKRFTKDYYLFHFPIKINAEKDINIDKTLNEVLRYNPNEVNIIGIDRGERNLIYISVINQKGEILEQKSLNIINSVDYHQKLDIREKERDIARKSWLTITKIKDLKEGYLSAVIHEISKLIIKYNAIVILENLNVGFKRGRFKVEKQVYQKFETMLSNKLNYLVLKDRTNNQPGSTSRGYQLANKIKSVENQSVKNGIIFYVQASYTSKIDPTTGFANVFLLNKIKTLKDKKEFIEKLDSIKYMKLDNKYKEIFEFTFDYNNFKTSQTMHKTKWKVYTNGMRITGKRNKQGQWEENTVDLTKELKETLEANNIKLNIGEELKETVLKDEKLINKFFSIFKLTLQMRNSNKNQDQLISPVLKNGKFYDSLEEQEKEFDAKLPIDADANGAYHIALKGLIILNRIWNCKDDKAKLTIKNADWFKFVQTR